LLAIAKVSEGQVDVRVHPTMIPDDYPIAKVGGVYNAIQIVGDACGDVMLSGSGAAAMPTGSAVVADIMDISHRILAGPASRSTQREDMSRARFAVKPVEEIRSLYYLRFVVLDRPGVLSQVSGIVGENNISIAKVIQHGRKESGSVPLV